jgi:hypothetical protein
MPSVFKFTRTERVDVRGYFSEPGAAEVALWDNEDGTVALEVCGMVFEGPSFATVLRELADVLEES